MLQFRYIKKCLSVKLLVSSYSSVLTYILGAQKNSLVEMVPLSTHNIHFGLEITKIFLVSNV